MKNNLVKQQHYVWREYLRNWVESNKVFTIYLKDKKIEFTSINNLAKQNFFYKFNLLTNLEIKFIEKIIDSSPTPVRNMQYNLLKDLMNIREYENLYKTVYKQNSDLMKNGYEPLHTLIENQGKKLINCTSLENLKKLNNEKDRIDALMFLCIQFLRTKRKRDDIIKNGIVHEKFINYNNIFSLLSIILGMNLACNLSFDENITFTLLTIEKKSSFEFITGDQPVLNLLANIKDDENNVEDLLLYYPISPKKSIKIGVNLDNEKFSEYYPSEKEVNELNIQILKKCSLYAFSKNESTLKELIN